jgi:aminopeptidase-like protein
MSHSTLYRVVVDVDHSPGSLTWGEAVIHGRTGAEVLFSTYICHPNLANDNVSGMVVAAKLAEYVQSLPHLRYTYRFVFAPETLGTLCFLHEHKRRGGRAPVAGFVLTTLGGPGPFYFKPTKRGDTLTDRATRNVLIDGVDSEVPFTATGADERQYCSPRVDWPIAVIGKPLFYTYPEYHTSADNLDYISEASLQESIILYTEIIDTLEANRRYWAIDPGILKLDQYGLYPTLGAQANQKDIVADVMALSVFSDGRDLIDIADHAGRRALDLAGLATEMTEKKLLEEI